MGMIRLLLAISVVVSHSTDIFGFDIIGGSKAVKLFFIISGFYMGLILTTKYVGVKNATITFFKSRLFRLFPLYLLLLLLQGGLCVVALWTNPDLESPLTHFAGSDPQVSTFTAIFLVFENLVLIGQESVFFFTLSTDGTMIFTTDFTSQTPLLHNYVFIPQAWSVSVELLFYFVAPFVIRRGIKMVGLFLLLGVGVNLLLYQLDLYHDPWNYRFFPSQLPFFLLGVMGYYFYAWFQKIELSKQREKLLNRSTDVLLIFMIITTIAYYKLPPIVSNDVKLVLFVIMYAVAIPLLFRRSKSWKVDRYIGELSYCVYLSHLIIIFILEMCSIEEAHDGLLVTVGTVLFSILIHEVFMKRMESLRQRFVSTNLQSGDK